MSTYFPKEGEIARKWYVVDASEHGLGPACLARSPAF